MSLAPQRSIQELDREIQKLAGNKEKWVKTSIAERIAILAEIKECLMPVAQAWAETAARKKGIAAGSPLTGEEWISGPYTVMGYCNQMMDTLSKVAGKKHLNGVNVHSANCGETGKWRPPCCRIRFGITCC